MNVKQYILYCSLVVRNAYLQEFKEIMRREGLSVDSFSVQDTPLGPALLRRFVEICFARGKEK